MLRQTAVNGLPIRTYRSVALLNGLRYKSSAATSSTTDLKERLSQLIPAKQEQVKRVRKDHGQKSLGNVTVDMVCFVMIANRKVVTILFFIHRLMVACVESRV